MIHTYLQLAGLFASLSLLSIGGGNAVLPEMHMQVVKGHHWLTDSQFADVFSISQAAPGPSILIVALVGYGAGLEAGGVPGAIIGGIIATVAMVIQTGRKCLTSLVPVLLALACFVLNGILRWPLPVTLAIVAPLALIWAWPRRRVA